jgi:putative acetyltransferase
MTATDLRIRKLRPSDRPELLRIWERSVRATHDFLGDADIVALRPHVAEALESDAVDWWLLVLPSDAPVGFLGFVNPTVEALFIDPGHFRRGAGRTLLAHAEALATEPLGVDVNEQHPGAMRFYEALGFRVIGRSPTDSAGRPFPLLHLRRPDRVRGETT